MIVALSTWRHGFVPNQITYDVLVPGGTALDAVEEGAKFCEGDLTCMSVGASGIPDSEGFVTLDASIMDHTGACGSVCYVQNYLHVASIARRVMEKTPHVMLAGDGAEAFAAREGFEKSELLTEKAKRLYDQWKQFPNKLKVRLRRASEGEHEYVFETFDDAGGRQELDYQTLQPVNEGNHDTIGIVARDAQGRLAGACTTSGLAFKLHGRVGDSPIIGSGLFVDGEVAAAVATGNGELVMRACSTFHVVEMIRQGIEPDEALNRAMKRIEKDRYLDDEMQVGIMVIRRDGVWSARGLREGFQFAAATEALRKNTLFDAGRTGFSNTHA